VELTRRRLLGLSAGVGAGLLLAGCGGQPTPAGGPTGAPRAGGVLRVGALGSVLLSRLRHERGLALLLVSHDLGLVAAHTDRAIALRGGAVVSRGPTGEVLAVQA
jgi:hypothetical protein